MRDSSNNTQSRRRSELFRQPEETAFAFGIAVPLFLVVVGLKLWRVVDRGEVAAWWAAPDLIRSDLMAVVAFSALGLVALRSLPRRIPRPVILGLTQSFAVVWGALEVIANHFYSVTGSTFDLHLLFFSIGRFDETFDVIASEVPMTSWGFLGFVVTVFVVLPWGLRRWAKQHRDSSGESLRGGDPRITAAIGLGCLVLAVLPPIAEDYTAFARANVVNMVLSVQDVRITGSLEDRFDRRALEQLQLVETAETDEGPTNVAIIILESTRARSTTVHNPEMETTPFLAELAEESTVAERAYATLPHTSKALVAMLCGIEPRLRMPITEAQTDGLPARCLADLLGDEGYRSLFIQTATERFEDRPGLVDNMGYDDFIPEEGMDTSSYEPANYFGYEDAIMLPYSEDWLATHGDEPFLATYLTLTPHHDYLAPKERYGRFEFADDDELNRYKNTLYYVDQFTRELFEQYREQGVYDDTLFVIMGDHGEAFGEHGRTQHDNVIWEEGIHVPLMIYDPTAPESERIDYPVSQIDLVPTIVDWLGYDVDGGDYPGMPIGESDEDRVVYSHCWYERRCMARIGQRLKYIDHFGQRAPEVYDIPDDPREQNNLADNKQSEIQQWRAEVYGWRESVNAMYREAQSEVVDDYLYDELPPDAVDHSFVLGDFARHLGYEIEVDELRRGQRVTMTHYFEVLDDIPGGWRLFVHGESGGEMLNLDHTPVDGMHPLDEWEPGTIVADEHSFRVPRDWSPGTFTLYLGIWHSDEGRVPVDGPDDGDRRAVVFEKPIR